MKDKFQIIPVDLLEEYKQRISAAELSEKFGRLVDTEISNFEFSFYTSVSSVFSNRIEGEEIELDSFIKHEKFGVEFMPEYTKKIDDLYNAYSFAKNNILNKYTIARAHKLLTTNLLITHQQGVIRNRNLYVLSPEGSIEYVAANLSEVKSETEKLCTDVQALLVENLSIEEVFYYASMIHLVFVKIQPYFDGNGMTARLLEKWFLSQKLGEKAWLIESEKNYHQQHEAYYINLHAVGSEYSNLNYDKALPFLFMLPEALDC